MTTYDRPTEATLHVHLANGETWEANPDDLAKFGYVNRLDAYMAFDDHLRDVLHAAGLIEREATEARLNPLRYLVELAINLPQLLTHPDMRETDAQVVAIEQALRDAEEAQR